MVRPRSTGCRNCVRRKVKCDEARPVCIKCNALGLSCPGYEPVQHVASAGRRKRSSSSHVASHPGKNSPTRKSLTPNHGRQRLDIVLEAQDAVFKDQVGSELAKSTLKDDRPLDVFISDIKPQLPYTKAWFEEVCREQVDPTFVSTVRALVFAHLTTTTGDSSLILRGRQSYGHSLKGLRYHVSRAEHADKAVLQSAILVLSMFEFYDACINLEIRPTTIREVEASGIGSDRWVAHARGLATIMRLQGPEPYMLWGSDRFAYVILRDILVILAYRSADYCFLSRPEWLPIIWRYCTRPFFHSFNAMHACSVHGPSLLRASQDPNLSKAERKQIYLRATEVLIDARKAFLFHMECVRRVSKEPAEIMTTNGHSPAEYRFDNVAHGPVGTPAAMCRHHSLVIVLNRVRMSGWDGCDRAAAEQESRMSAIEICKCIPTLENMGVSAYGVFTMALKPFFAEQALTACPPEYKDWLEEKIVYTPAWME